MSALKKSVSAFFMIFNVTAPGRCATLPTEEPMSDDKKLLDVIVSGPSDRPGRSPKKRIYSASVRFQDDYVPRGPVPSLPPRPKQVREVTPYGTFAPIVMPNSWVAKIHVLDLFARPPWELDPHFARWSEGGWSWYMAGVLRYVGDQLDVKLNLGEKYTKRMVELGKALCLPEKGKRVNPADYLLYQVAWYRCRKKADEKFMVFSPSACFPPLNVLLSARRADRAYFRDMWDELEGLTRVHSTLSRLPTHQYAPHFRRLRYHEAHLIDKHTVLRGDDRETVSRRLKNLLHFERVQRVDSEMTDSFLTLYAIVRLREVDEKGWFGPEHGDRLLSEEFGIPNYKRKSEAPAEFSGYAVIGEERPLLRLGGDDQKLYWG